MWLIQPLTAEIPEIIEQICIFWVLDPQLATLYMTLSVGTVNIYLNAINLSGIMVP